MIDRSYLAAIVVLCFGAALITGALMLAPLWLWQIGVKVGVFVSLVFALVFFLGRVR
jgi:hypothetical protein